MNHASYTKFYQMGKARVNKFLQLENWKLGTVITNAQEKSREDWVTHFDITISQILEDLIAELSMPHVLISEETWKDGLVTNFDQPLVILDPIDGTNGFKKGTKYFCLSLSIMEQGQAVFSWLWNFGTQEEEVSSLELKLNSHILPQTILLGLVSDSEWKKQLWSSVALKNEATKITLEPCGSIAYKLLLLAQGKCHFVASKQPKNLWDIAGGTHAVTAKGFKLYCQNSEVLTLKKIHWDAPLLWCKPEDRNTLNSLLFG